MFTAYVQAQRNFTRRYIITTPRRAGSRENALDHEILEPSTTPRLHVRWNLVSLPLVVTASSPVLESAAPKFALRSQELFSYQSWDTKISPGSEDKRKLAFERTSPISFRPSDGWFPGDAPWISRLLSFRTPTRSPFNQPYSFASLTPHRVFCSTLVISLTS